MAHHFIVWILALGCRVGADEDVEGKCSAIEGRNSCEAERQLEEKFTLYGLAADDDLIWKRLLIEEGITKGTPTSQDILSKYDNLNYFGTGGALEMLEVVRERTKLEPPIKLVDVGSGYGGTSRFLVKHFGGGSSAYACELRESAHRAGQTLSSMAAAAGEFPEGSVHHVRADLVQGVALEGSLPAPNSIDLMVSRLAIYHMGDEAGRNSLYSHIALWLKPGGVIAVEDFACEEDGLTEIGLDVTTNKIAGGWVPKHSEYKAMLEKHGFKDVVIEDLTKRTAEFTLQRSLNANAVTGPYDARYGEENGKEIRQFFADVSFLFNPPEGQKTGNTFIRVYATKA